MEKLNLKATLEEHQNKMAQHQERLQAHTDEANFNATEAMAASKAALEDLDSYEATYRQGVQEGKLAQCQEAMDYFAR